MGMIDPGDIEMSADVVSLLSLCVTVARQIAKGDGDPRELGADLCRCLMMTHDQAIQIHDVMHDAGRRRRT